MRLPNNRLLLFFGSIAIGAGLMGLSLAIPSVYASYYEENFADRSLEYFLLKDTDLDTTNDVIGILAKPDTDDSLTITTGWVSSGKPKCASRCTGACSAAGNIENDPNFGTGSTYYGSFLAAFSTNESQTIRIPDASYFKTTQPSPGKKLTVITKRTTANDDGDCLEVVNSETWTFFKYSGTMD